MKELAIKIRRGSEAARAKFHDGRWKMVYEISTDDFKTWIVAGPNAGIHDIVQKILEDAGELI